MKINARTQNIAFVCAVALLCLLVFLQDCRKEKQAVTGEKEIIEKVLTDSVGLKRYRDSANAAYNSLRQENELYKAEAAQLRAKLAGVRRAVRDASTAVRVIEAPAECDSLANAAEWLSEYSEQLESQMDSIGANYEEQVQTLSGIIARQDSSINILRGSVTSLNNIIDFKNSEFKKLSRNNRWQKAKGKVVAGVALAAIGKIIFDLVKK